MIAIGLVRPKDPANIGGVLRAGHCYGADALIIEGCRNRKRVNGQAADTPKAIRSIPTMLLDDLFDGHPVGTVPVAVDLVDDAVPLFNFAHPARAFYIFGPEDGTLGKKHLDRCAHRVMIPTRNCMNLAATVNVVLYDRMAKLSSRTKAAA